MSSLSEKEVWEKLDAFEESTGVLTILIDGVPVWQILRFSIASRLQNLKWNKPSSSRKELFVALIRGLIFWRVRRSRYIVQSLYSGARLQKTDGFGDVWFDDLLEHVPGGAKFIRFNAPGYSKRQSKLSRSFSYDTTLLNYIAIICARFFSVKDSHKNAQTISDLAIKELGLSHLTAKFIKRRVSVHLWQKRLLGLLLKLVRPKSVVVIDTGEFAMIHACRDLGIRLVELQHGIFTRYHPRSLRRKYGQQPGILHSSAISLYGAYWKNELDETHFSSKNVLTLAGNSLLEKYRSMRALRHVNSVTTIVVTTQPFDLESMTNFFAIFLAQNKGNFRLVFKLHPASGKEFGPLKELLRDQRVQIFSALDGPNTYELISKTDFHLSVASACHFDALAIGTPTVVLGLEGYELMLDIISMKAATLITKPAELIELLSVPSVIVPDPENFCASGFYENMKLIVL